MAEIVLGMGTSHGPMLVTPSEQWAARVPFDRQQPRHFFQGKTFTFDELKVLRAGEHLEKQVTQDVWDKRYAACRAAIEELARVFAEVKPDVAVLVGNDQMEMFTDAVIPAFSVYWGEHIENRMPPAEELAKLGPGLAVAQEGRIPREGATYDGEPDLGRAIIETVTADGFDVAAQKRLRPGRTAIPHAYGFVYRQIMKDRVPPNVPLALNTFYPPNQPSVARCYAFGKSVVKAIEDWDSDAKVALIATGGLSHFVIDEEVDNLVLDALRERKIEKVAELDESIFQAGTSEVKNWVPVAGAMADLGLDLTVVDYVPCYRSEAGTGSGMGFVYWR
jgi:3-O-methylgallate 3,4-dioxygenase